MATHKMLLHLLLYVIVIHAFTAYACIDVEKEALLAFKAGIMDSSKMLSSWNQSEDCCSWRGVVCDNRTSNILELNLGNPCHRDSDWTNWFNGALSGEINPSLLALNYLTLLDLSNNNFSKITIPKFIGSFKNLRHLNLSNSQFGGKIPHQLANLSKLRSLDITFSSFTGTVPPQLGNLSDLQYLSLKSAFSYSHVASVDNLWWLSRLSSLQYLDVSYLNLSSVVDWLQVVNKLQNIKVLRMAYCSLLQFPASLSYVNFTALTTLDISVIHLPYAATFPTWIGNLSNLSYLNVQECGFQGKNIPDALGNLTSLSYLYLGYNNFAGTLPRSVEKLCSLREIDMNSVGMEGDIAELVQMFRCAWNNIEWMVLANNNFGGNLYSWLDQMVNLQFLDLWSNSLVGSIPPGIGNLSRLTTLDLSSNSLVGSIPPGIGNLSRLTTLDLNSNSLVGSIPLGIGNLSRLTTMDISSNFLVGSIPPGIGNLSRLSFLDLSWNSLVGSIPTEIGNLYRLISLYLRNNSLEGVISETHFTNLNALQYLDLSSNLLTISVDHSWVPPFQLYNIYLESCRLGPRFPEWLRWQKQGDELVLTNTRIADVMPDWFWSLSFTSVDLSYNKIKGKLPTSLPPLLQTLTVLDLSNNLISGTLQPMLKVPVLEIMLLSDNLINGNIPSYICEMESLYILDLSNNYLSGKLPNCWRKSSRISVMDFSNNNITGRIPSSVGSLTSLRSLSLNNNSLYGELPLELQYCQALFFLDLGNNKFSGKIPTWIGENLQNLVFLQLRSNMFVGGIPVKIAQLIQVLDLANNSLSGQIPHLFGNFNSTWFDSDEIYKDNVRRVRYDPFEGYKDNMRLVMQGKVYQYSSILYLVKTMDLLENNLSGEIPEEIGALQQLESLNLSGNHLIGRIPEKIGDMTNLESLDLSRNELSGSIPQSISALSFLHNLNLSYNNLSGSIPSGNQLATLDDPSIYIGNAYLCGPPTAKNCSIDQAKPISASNYVNSSEMLWLYLGMALGFVFGFWSVCGVLLFNGTWRNTYFRMIDKLFDKIYVSVAVPMNRLKRKWG